MATLALVAAGIGGVMFVGGKTLSPAARLSMWAIVVTLMWDDTINSGSDFNIFDLALVLLISFGILGVRG